MTKNNLVKGIIMTGLWAVLLIPFFVANSMFFPFISGKNFTFRIIVEIIFALWVYIAFVDAKYRPKFSWISISVFAFVFIMALADIFALNPYKAIWSNFERMDGFITLAHLFMYLVVFGSVMKSEKNWLWFFRSSLIVSMFMVILVFKEWIGTGAIRVSVTLGNPIYVAVYFMFNFFFALMLLNKDVVVKSENTERPFKTIFTNWLTYVYLAAAFLCAFGIWRTSTRGVILGLLGGLVITSIIVAIFEKKNKFIKNSSIGLLVIIAILVGGFLSLKNTQFVKNDVTLQRLAEISWSDVNGQGQARQYVWPMAIKGFLERPILGWGQDGFNNVFNKFYDVKMYNQEQWFDRAHDTPLDVLVAGGILGLLSYLFIFLAALFVVIKKKNNFEPVEAGLVVGLLAAYFAQNLFVFDNLISYIFFYVVLAYLYGRETEGETKDKRVVSEDIANYVVLPIVGVILVTTLWYCNIKPINANQNLIVAMQTFQEASSGQNLPQETRNQLLGTTLEYFKKVFDTNTFGSPEAREQIVTFAPSVASAAAVDANIKQQFVDLAFTQMQEQLKETPYDARYNFFMGIFLNNMNQYQLSLPYLQKAVELSPDKLTMLFELAKCYGYVGQKELALSTAKKAYDLLPTFDDARLNYAAALILNGKEAEAKILIATPTVTNENIVRAYLIRASDFIKVGDKNSAVAEVRKAMAIAPAFKNQGDAVIKGILDGTVK